ncbi:uncharacterized protein LOC126811398 [Patella vulgata]|uniref:uncharacterized protein LOC126811398 n=1 Tax=Patella vulgata TaxID=6465 RepID=UPI0024A8FE3A|nr:uncharacterized protein LOC126811398 [Patella vulgata]
MGFNVNRANEDGLGSFYDANRPSYTDEAVDKILELIRNIELPKGQANSLQYDIVELGAGTGKFTTKLIEKLQSEKYLATEPSENFVNTMKKHGIDALQCAANDLPLPDNSVKAIVGAECFHWFANVKSLTEINRVLVPNGLLVLVWNRKDQDVPWVDELLKSVESYMGDNPPPQYFDMKWKDVFKHVKYIQHVQDYKLKGIKFEGSADFLLDNLFSKSYMSKMSTEEKLKAREKLLKVVQKHHGNNSSIDVPSYTIIHLYKKIN